MDRRTILAVALSFLVYLAWMMFFGPKPGDRPEGAPDDGPVATAGSETERSVPELGEPDTPRSRPRDDTPGAIALDDPLQFSGPTAELPSREIDVDTPLYHATFSTSGGGLTELVLHDYDFPDGTPLVLVSAGAAQPVLEIDADGVGPLVPIEMADAVFEVRSEPRNGLDVGQLTFTARSVGGATVERTYRFDPETYVILTSTRLDGFPDQYEGRVETRWTAGMPVTERFEKTDLSEFKTLVRVGDDIEQKKLGDFKGTETSHSYEGDVRWVASRTHYFISALFLNGSRANEAVAFGRQETSWIGYAVASPIAEGAYTADQKLYLGPIVSERLANLGEGIDQKVGIPAAMMGGSIFGWLAELLHKFLNVIYSVIPNYGVAIMVVAFVTKLLFFPLSRKSAKQMKAMSAIKPELEALQKKYKDNREKLGTETMALYKKHGVNPMAGCLPMVIQMPVFLALYGVLRGAIELRQAPFMLWIDDLSSPDVLFTLGSIPVLPDQIHLLPLIMAASTILMQRTTMVTDPTQKTMMYMMPVMMLVFFYQLPAGLNLYWTVQNLLSFGEQALVKGTTQTAAAKAA